MSRLLMKLVDSYQAKCEFMLASNVSAVHPKAFTSTATELLLQHMTSPPSAANSSTAILFHIALDRRINAASDSNILLLALTQMTDTCEIKQKTLLSLISTVQLSTYSILAMCL